VRKASWERLWADNGVARGHEMTDLRRLTGSRTRALRTSSLDSEAEKRKLLRLSGGAEERSFLRGIGPRMFERSEFARAPAKSKHRRLPCAERAGTPPAGSPFFAYFLWRSKESESPAGARPGTAVHSKREHRKRYCRLRAPYPTPPPHSPPSGARGEMCAYRSACGGGSHKGTPPCPIMNSPCPSTKPPRAPCAWATR
jgi:hypothetical protein